MSPGWSADAALRFGPSSAIWVTASLPTKQSSSSINVRWARGRVPLRLAPPPLLLSVTSSTKPLPCWRQWHTVVWRFNSRGGEGWEWQLGWAMKTRSAPLPRRCTNQGTYKRRRGSWRMAGLAALCKEQQEGNKKIRAEKSHCPNLLHVISLLPPCQRGVRCCTVPSQTVNKRHSSIA